MQNAVTRPDPGHPELRLYTIPQTAELLGDVSGMHVYRLIAAGALRAVDIAAPGSRKSKTRVRSDDLADYIKRQTRGVRQTA
jgi:excisionase family DNA binding protein